MYTLRAGAKETEAHCAFDAPFDVSLLRADRRAALIDTPSQRGERQRERASKRGHIIVALFCFTTKRAKAPHVASPVGNYMKYAVHNQAV